MSDSGPDLPASQSTQWGSTCISIKDMQCSKWLMGELDSIFKTVQGNDENEWIINSATA